MINKAYDNLIKKKFVKNSYPFARKKNISLVIKKTNVMT